MHTFQFENSVIERKKKIEIMNAFVKKRAQFSTF